LSEGENMIKILCDVCADIPVDIAKERDILCLPMTLTVNDVERVYTAETFDCKAFYDGMRAGDRCSTSQIVIENYKELAKELNTPLDIDQLEDAYKVFEETGNIDLYTKA
jgi:fatty acid-binding protein DegV